MNNSRKKFHLWWLWSLLLLAAFCVLAIKENSPIQTVQGDTPNSELPIEYETALTRAQNYSNKMHMSKQDIIDQLNVGDDFSQDAIHYAMNKLKANYNHNAFAKAKDYQQEMSLSKKSIRHQLTAKSGDQFTQQQADYALEHLK